jgi:hypothetical protein
MLENRFARVIFLTLGVIAICTSSETKFTFSITTSLLKFCVNNASQQDKICVSQLKLRTLGKNLKTVPRSTFNILTVWAQ